MTINQLIKKLQKIETKYGKRIKVCVNRADIANYHSDFSHHLLNVVEVECITWSKDDSTELANGQERLKTIVSVK